MCSGGTWSLVLVMLTLTATVVVASLLYYSTVRSAFL